MRLNKQSATGSVMARTPLDKDGWGSEKEGGRARDWDRQQRAKSTPLPPHALNSKKTGVQKLPLINCKQREGMGGGKPDSCLAYVISTLGQMMSSIKMDTVICHLFPHQSNLSILTSRWHMNVCVCVCVGVCVCVCVCSIKTVRQCPGLTWWALPSIHSTALWSISKTYNLFNSLCDFWPDKNVMPSWKTQCNKFSFNFPLQPWYHLNLEGEEKSLYGGSSLLCHTAISDFRIFCWFKPNVHLHVNVLIYSVLLIFTTLSDEISLAQQKHKNHFEMRRNVLAFPTGVA